MSVFCMFGRVGVVPVVVLLVAPLVFRPPSGPAAREARRPHFVRRRASKPARALRSLRRPPHRRHLRCCVVSARPRGGLQEVLPWHVLSNFARNSPESVSGFEIRSLIFRGFRATGEWGPGGITCDFGVGRECGCGWGCVGGVAMGVAGVSWGADLVRMWCG